MLISVRVYPKAKKNEVIKLSENSFKVKTTAPAEKNKANINVIKLLADYLGVNKKQINLKAGFKSKDKLVEIEEK